MIVVKTIKEALNLGVLSICPNSNEYYSNFICIVYCDEINDIYVLDNELLQKYIKYYFEIRNKLSNEYLCRLVALNKVIYGYYKCLCSNNTCPCSEYINNNCRCLKYIEQM